jgi:hypothetical protein
MADQDKERANQEREGGAGQQQGGGSAQAGNDQAGGGLGQNHSGYGGDNGPAGGAEGSGEDAQQQASEGIAVRTDNLGPGPSGGANQPKSSTTGGPDLSKGLADNNRGGGTTF